MRIVFLLSIAAGCAEQAATTTTCPESITAYCAENIHVCPNWTQAQDPSSWGCSGSLVLQHCGDRMVASLAGTDTSEDFTYDLDGNLVAISHYNANSQVMTCVAGAPPVERCSDPNAQRIALCPP